MVRRVNLSVLGLPAVLAGLLGLLAAVLVPLLVAGPAEAAARVSVTNDRGSALIDGTYATTITVRGSGFQSVRGGHGGLYVWFGTVSGRWQPSQGGVSGENYLYVPDSESKSNAGHQRYIAFPGSDTASSANGGTLREDGSFTVDLVVPGPVFDAVGRNGKVRSVDCRTTTCGVITVGAHGVKNPRNETFTPMKVSTVYDAAPQAGTDAGTADTGTGGTDTGGTDTGTGTGAAPEAAPAAGATPAAGRKARAAKPTLEVDRASAKAGHVLAFTGTGLPAGRQVSVVFDDGLAASGPFLVGADGGIAGVVALPAEVAAGTHELRVFGLDDPPSVSFAVAPGTDAAPVSSAAEEDDWAPALFAGGCALVLLAVLGRLGWQWRRSRRAQA